METGKQFLKKNNKKKFKKNEKISQNFEVFDS